MDLFKKVFESLQWRLGIKRQELQLNRMEDKMDFLLRRFCEEKSFEPMSGHIIATDGYPVVFIADRNYFEPTLVSINSLCRHAGEKTSYRIFLVLTDCSPAEVSRAESLFPGIEVISYSPPEFTIPSKTHVTATALLKFELPEILSGENRVLYLDGDTIVKKDLSVLFQMDIRDCYAAVVPDCRAIYEKYPQSIGLKNKFYFNSGVLLLNLDKMRADGIQNKLTELRRTSPDFHFVDQDCFNLIFRNKTLQLPLEYNMMLDNLSLCMIPIRELSALTGRSVPETLQALRSPAICHYGSSKPWNSSKVFHYGLYLEEIEYFERCYGRRQKREEGA